MHYRTYFEIFYTQLNSSVNIGFDAQTTCFAWHKLSTLPYHVNKAISTFNLIKIDASSVTNMTQFRKPIYWESFMEDQSSTCYVRLVLYSNRNSSNPLLNDLYNTLKKDSEDELSKYFIIAFFSLIALVLICCCLPKIRKVCRENSHRFNGSFQRFTDETDATGEHAFEMQEQPHPQTESKTIEDETSAVTPV